MSSTRQSRLSKLAKQARQTHGVLVDFHGKRYMLGQEELTREEYEELKSKFDITVIHVRYTGEEDE